MRILVIRLSSLGDIVLTQPIVRELRSMYPEAEIEILCKPGFAVLPQSFGLDVKVLEYAKTLAWHGRMLKRRYDLVLDLQAKFSSWLVRSLVHSPLKTVYNKQRRLRQSIVRGNPTVAIESTVRLYYSALEKAFPNRFTPETKVLAPHLVLPEIGVNGTRLIKRDPGSQLIGVFVGAAHATKAYPPQQWIELLHLAPQGYRFVLLGSKADVELAAEIERECGGVENLCGKLGLAELIVVIGLCDAVISGDTGPMHVAAALAKPQVAIFGGTHPRLGFAPQNEKARVICADLDCQPCSLHGLERCPQGHLRCLRSIPPALILGELKKLI